MLNNTVLITLDWIKPL